MATSTYAWDWRNRLTTSTVSGVTTTFSYDHTFERVMKTSGATSTVYANDLYNTDGTTKTKYIFANGELVATIKTTGATSTPAYIHTDHLGGVNVITDESGDIVEVSDYYPFGKERISLGSGEERGYIGEIYDQESSLSYLNARYYEGSRGQFLSQDPVFWEVGVTQDGMSVLSNPQLQNSYSYAGGNPITERDPSGRCPVCVPIIAAGGVGIIGGIANQIYSDYTTGDFSSRSWKENLSRYSVAAGQGAIVGAGTAAAGIAAVGVGLSAGVATLLAGGTAGTLTVGTTVLGDNILGQETNGEELAVGATVSALTAGTLKTLPKVPGRLPNLGTKAFFVGAHTQRQAAEEFVSVGTQAFSRAAYNSVSNGGSMSGGSGGASIVQQLRSIVSKLQSLVNKLSNSSNRR